MIERQRLPERPDTADFWEARLDSIAGFERHLSRNGCLLVKFLLHISPEEQRRRFLRRLDDPQKNWKFAIGDLTERQRWDEYAAAYQRAVAASAAPHAPWYVVPADHKWFARLVVAAVVAESLEALGLSYPIPDEARRRELEDARASLSPASRGRSDRAGKRRGGKTAAF